MYPRGQSNIGPTGTGPSGVSAGGPTNNATKPTSDYGNYGAGYGNNII